MILDASVAAKWFLPDEATDAADRLLRQYQRGEIALAVPDLFWPEMANLLARAARRRRIAPAASVAALDLLRALKLRTLATEPFAVDALRLALHWQMPIYDLFYALVARSTGDELVTADERLVRTLGSRFPVRWLAALT